MPRGVERAAEDDVTFTKDTNDMSTNLVVDVPTKVSVSPRVTSISSDDMGPPLELWGEVIREAGAIQDEFECPAPVEQPDNSGNPAAGETGDVNILFSVVS